MCDIVFDMVKGFGETVNRMIDYAAAVVRKGSIKKIFHEITKTSLANTCGQVSLLIKLPIVDMQPN